LQYLPHRSFSACIPPRVLDSTGLQNNPGTGMIPVTGVAKESLSQNLPCLAALLVIRQAQQSAVSGMFRGRRSRPGPGYGAVLPVSCTCVTCQNIRDRLFGIHGTPSRYEPGRTDQLQNRMAGFRQVPLLYVSAGRCPAWSSLGRFSELAFPGNRSAASYASLASPCTARRFLPTPRCDRNRFEAGPAANKE